MELCPIGRGVGPSPLSRSFGAKRQAARSALRGKAVTSRRAAQCVVDACFADVDLGPRGGWERARLIWRNRAKRQTPDDVLASLAALKP